MKELIPLINDYTILLHLALIIVILALCVIIRHRDKTNKELLKFYSTLMESYDKGNLESIIQQLISKQEKNSNRLQAIEDRVAIIEAQLPEHIDRVAMLRYNAFPDIGKIGGISVKYCYLPHNGRRKVKIPHLFMLRGVEVQLTVGSEFGSQLPTSNQE